MCVNVNGRQLKFVKSEEDALSSGEGIVWNKENRCLSVYTKMMPIDRSLLIQGIKDCPADENK